MSLNYLVVGPKSVLVYKAVYFTGLIYEEAIQKARPAPVADHDFV